MKKSKKDGESIFDKLFNDSSTQDLDDLTIQRQNMAVIICAKLANLELKRP